MTLEVFNRDFVPIVMMVLGVLGLGSLFLVWHQIRETAKWNKMQGQAAFLNRDVEEMERDLSARLKSIGVEWYGPIRALPETTVTTIMSDDDLNRAVKTYLNVHEDLAAGVRIGFVDDDFAYALESARLVATWTRFESYAEAQRKRMEDEEIYIELENVAIKWTKRSAESRTKRSKRRQDDKARLGIARPKA